MAKRPNASWQTAAVMESLSTGSEWRHGYDIARDTGLKSGTLYPILMRLERHGWLEARWEDEPHPGKPRRHLYRLSSEGATHLPVVLASSERHRTRQPRRADGTATG